MLLRDLPLIRENIGEITDEATGQIDYPKLATFLSKQESKFMKDGSMTNGSFKKNSDGTVYTLLVEIKRSLITENGLPGKAEGVDPEKRTDKLWADDIQTPKISTIPRPINFFINFIYNTDKSLASVTIAKTIHKDVHNTKGWLTVVEQVYPAP